jgi:PAS domain S-box-containing protein
MAGESFQALVENAPDGIVVSRDGIVLYANAAAGRLLGYDDVSEMVGRPMTFLDRNAALMMRQRIQHMVATGERLVPREYPARRKDGAEITAEIASTVIEFEGAPAILAYARDVTDRKRLQTQLAHAHRLASLGTMAAGVGHEINNPLAFIGLAAEMLSRRVGPEEASLVAQVRTGVERIAGIVRDLRAFGRDSDEPAGAVDLRAAIEAAERLVQHELRPRATVVKELGELPVVVGVARHLEQVFVNLLLNAAQALDDRADGRVSLRSRTTATHVVVSIEDDGHGIPAESLEAIFEPFVTTRGAEGGTGLGLSICRDIVVRAGGTLVATSAPGRGTVMEVTLPRAPHDAARANPAPIPSPRPNTERLRILVVDDEPLLVNTLAKMLAPHATVVPETVPERALELALGAQEFDVVVCDVMMPGLTGIDLHERLLRDKPDLAARFVFITGGAYTPRTRDYLERAHNPRLFKPFDVAELLDAIARVTTQGPS